MSIKFFRLGTIALIAALWFAAGPSRLLAMDRNGRYFARGVGSRSCSDYIKFREKGSENFTPEQYDVAKAIVEHWMAGFFTAHNFYVADTYDVVGTLTMDQLEERMEKFCRDNPNSRVAEAVVAVAQELNPGRIRLDPGSATQKKDAGK